MWIELESRRTLILTNSKRGESSAYVILATSSLRFGYETTQLVKCVPLPAHLPTTAKSASTPPQQLPKCQAQRLNILLYFASIFSRMERFVSTLTDSGHILICSPLAFDDSPQRALPT